MITLRRDTDDLACIRAKNSRPISTVKVGQ
jgi:hypothetical protein